MKNYKDILRKNKIEKVNAEKANKGLLAQATMARKAREPAPLQTPAPMQATPQSHLNHTPPMEKESKFYHFIERNKWWSIKGMKERLKVNKHPEDAILINFELNNGFHRQIIAREKGGGFKYKDKLYSLDNEMKYYNIDAKLWCYDFHEDLAIPIKRSIPIEDIKRTIEKTKITDITYATNPANLERFIQGKIIEAIMKGASLDEWMKQMRVIGIITLFIVSIFFIVFVFKSGMLSQIHIPGFG
jgi:hypothetical protein